ncbi:MAG TPA: HAD family hydrolase [Thermoanaerobaculia bacterium]|nr:HAD family hydrolase [Thermoanaerobaculia bacterium]
MRLIVFDIDGTLTRTDQIDEICYVRAFEEELGWTGISTDWAGYPSCTDEAIALEIFARHGGRPPRDGEIDRVRRRFLSLLEAALVEGTFTEIPGAGEALWRLRSDSRFRVALATGAWEASARLKLRAAGLEVGGIPLATSDDHPNREEIVRRAMARAEAANGPFESIVSVGDGVWDVRTAQALGIGFVGIGHGERAGRLRREGAGRVFEDFRDWDAFVECLTA